MAIFLLTILLTILSAPSQLAAQAQLDSYRVHTYAGSDSIRDDGPAVEAFLNSPEGVAVDSQGVVYIADRLNALVRRIDPNTGVITTVAGSATAPGTGNLATELFIDPVRVAVSPDGTLHFCTTNQVYRLTSDGVAEIIAGVRGSGDPGDGGPAIEARFGIISGFAFGPDGSYYLADSFRHVVRRVGLDGVITLFAGTGERGFGGDDGPATGAQVSSPTNIDLDTAGNLYIVDRGNHRIRRVAPDGTISTILGNGTFSTFGLDGPAVDGGVANPLAVAAGPGGDVFVANFSEIFKIDGAGVFTRIGGAGRSVLGDGEPLNRASFRGVLALVAPADGTLLIVDNGYHRIRRAGTDGIVSTIAGTDHFVGDGGPATQAQLFEPQGIDLDSQGNLYIADAENDAIRRVSPDGAITTIAGGVTSGLVGDGGPAIEANLIGAVDVAIHPGGEVYLIDGRRLVRRVNAAGVITTVAGGAAFGTKGEGVPATAVAFNTPRHISFDSAGNLYVTDLFAYTVQRVDTNGIITTVAGNGTRGSSGDGGQATEAQLQNPVAAVMGPDGALYIAEGLRIRKVASDGIISTLITLRNFPASLSLTPSGDLLAVNSSNNSVWRIGLDGSFFDMGRMITGFAGDGGIASDARANSLESAVEHPDGRIFLSDRRNDRIRVLVPFPSIARNGILQAASFFTGAVAPETIISLFGFNLALELQVAESVPLPTNLGGVSVIVRDSQGVDRLASLFFVSRGQINLLIPAGTAAGAAVLIVRTDLGDEAEIELTVSETAPGLFAANANGEGVAAGTWLRVDGNGAQTSGPLFEFNSGQGVFVERPIDLGPEGDQVFLVLFGTGIRGAGGVDRLEATINGEPIAILFADAQGAFVGLDQINLGPIPRSLLGAGVIEIKIRVRANNRTTNGVTLAVQ